MLGTALVAADDRRPARERRPRARGRADRAAARARAVPAAAQRRRAVPRLGGRDGGGRADPRRSSTCPPAVVGPVAPAPCPEPALEPVLLREVAFTYPGRPGGVLRDVSLRLDPGETVALVGPSGGGQVDDRLAAAAPRRPRRGRRAVRRAPTCARSIRASGAGAWRGCRSGRRCSPRSVADNVRLAAPGRDRGARRRGAGGGERARVRRGAARRRRDARSARAAARSPPGQAQRIALARAFLGDSSLVVLDEPTAHLDAESERAVADAVRRLVAGRTALLDRPPSRARARGRPDRRAARRPPARRAGRDGGAGVSARRDALRRAAAATRPRWRLAALSALLATAAVLCAGALLAVSGYLVSRAAQRPEILLLTTAIVGVRFFAHRARDPPLPRADLLARPRLPDADRPARALLPPARAARAGRPARPRQRRPALALRRRRRPAAGPLPARDRPARRRAARRHRRRSPRRRSCCPPPRS